MTKVSKKDFVEVEYTGTIKEDGFVFDTTDVDVAKANGLYNDKMEYGPVVVCLGQGQLLTGLEEELEGKEIGKDLTVELAPEKAFGKKDAKLIRMIPYAAFRKQGVEPQPGMQVNIDGAIGIIKTATGGRCMVDFNHPLSGKELIYKVKINKIVTDDAEKIKSFLRMNLNLKSDVSFKEGNAEIKVEKALPKEIMDTVGKKIKELIPSIKKINFKAEKESGELAKAAPEKK
jgi:FKBP-type peptidyl-prolyl cis-trans isomerase SlyD